MKSFIHFSEDIETRRRNAAETRRAQLNSNQELVSSYRENQAAQAQQRRDDIETINKEKRAAQRIAQLQQKQNDLERQIQQQQTEELQLEQIPNSTLMRAGSLHRSHVHRELASTAKSEQSAKRERLKSIMSREE